jgi:transposase InsO family protein
MKTHRDEFPVEMMARILDVSRAGFYAALSRPPSARHLVQVEFDCEVREEFEKSRGHYGRDRVTRALRRRGRSCNRKRVARSLKRQGLRARPARKFIATTDSRHSFPVAPNLLERNFTAERPNQKWVSDITYLPCLQGWLYLAVFIDLYSRRVVGWCVSHSLKHETVLTAFYRAAGGRGTVRGIILHTDRGVQYCCNGFTEAMALYGVIQSMSRKGDCWDNAVAESFFSTLKREMLEDYIFVDLADAQRRLFKYIEVEYNRQRLHSALGYVPPVEFEQLRWQKSA